MQKIREEIAKEHQWHLDNEDANHLDTGILLGALNLIDGLLEGGEENMVSDTNPAGWYYRSNRKESRWIGPFDTKKEATDCADNLEPETATMVEVIHLEATEGQNHQLPAKVTTEG